MVLLVHHVYNLFVLDSADDFDFFGDIRSKYFDQIKPGIRWGDKMSYMLWGQSFDAGC